MAAAKTERVLREITTTAQAKKLAKRVVELSDEIKAWNEDVKAWEKRDGIDKLRAEIPILNQRLLNFMQAKKMTKLDLEEDGYVNFVQATSEHVWISTTNEIPVDAPKGAKSLRKILGKDLWLRVTRRVVDPKRIEELIDEGEITEEQVAPAHFTRKRAPYIRFGRENVERDS